MSRIGIHVLAGQYLALCSPSLEGYGRLISDGGVLLHVHVWTPIWGLFKGGYTLKVGFDPCIHDHSFIFRPLWKESVGMWSRWMLNLRRRPLMIRVIDSFIRMAVILFTKNSHGVIEIRSRKNNILSIWSLSNLSILQYNARAIRAKSSLYENNDKDTNMQTFVSSRHWK